MNSKKVKRKFWLKVLMSPLTLIPFLGGLSSFIILGALGKLIQAVLLLLVGLGVGGGFFCTNSLTRSKKFLDAAKKEAAEEDRQKREEALDELDRKLARDRDKRTNAALSDLRGLANAFRTEFDWGNKASSSAASELLSIISKNFSQCVKTLEATLKLYNTINGSELSEAVKNPLKRKREEMIAKVQENVKNLTSVFEQMQELSTTDDPSLELTKHASELSRQLDLMKRIDERTKKLDKQIKLGDVPEPSGANEEDWFGDLEF